MGRGANGVALRGLIMANDAALLAKVREALAQEGVPGHSRVHLKAVGGVIFLDGEVNSEEDKEALEELLRKVEGVLFVQNRAQVNPTDTPELHKPHHVAQK
jgi:osmotically-inducible protein OsmY